MKDQITGVEYYNIRNNLQIKSSLALADYYTYWFSFSAFQYRGYDSKGGVEPP